MQSATVFFALVAVVAVSAAPGGIGYGHFGHGIVKDVYAYPKYEYSYGVADKFTGDQKSQYEVREGGVTKGYYSVVQPDGVLRTVNYVADPIHGFQAQVINKGIAGHPGLIKHVGFAGHGHHGHGIGYGHFG